MSRTNKHQRARQHFLVIKSAPRNEYGSAVLSDEELHELKRDEWRLSRRIGNDRKSAAAMKVKLRRAEKRGDRARALGDTDA